jgi:hypothetical protein
MKMRKDFFLSMLMIFSVSGVALSQSFPARIKRADSLYNARMFSESALCYVQAFNSINEKYIEPTVFYNCACSFSLAGNLRQSFFYLNKAIHRGGLSSKQLMADEDFQNLKTDKRWKLAVDAVTEIENKLDTNLVTILKGLSKSDQLYRRKIDSIYTHKVSNDSLLNLFWKKQELQDSINLQIAKKILEKGYPSKILAGRYNEALFNVIQHSDLTNMEKYVNSFIDAANSGDLSWSTLALMIDRIRKRKGQKQIYGTQFIKKDNRMALYDVEDRENLNERRIRIGLSTIEEEFKFWNAR